MGTLMHGRKWMFVMLAAALLAFACQCSALPTPEPTATGTAVPTLVATLMSSPTPTRQISPTATETAVPTQTATPLPTQTETAVPATVVATATAVPTPVATATELPETYTVGRDEWLISIAQELYQSQYGWEWQCLWRVNRAVIGDDPNLIYRGQVLRGVRGCRGHD